jgi:hypothetical protein
LSELWRSSCAQYSAVFVGKRKESAVF